MYRWGMRYVASSGISSKPLLVILIAQYGPADDIDKFSVL